MKHARELTGLAVSHLSKTDIRVIVLKDNKIRPLIPLIVGLFFTIHSVLLRRDLIRIFNWSFLLILALLNVLFVYNVFRNEKAYKILKVLLYISIIWIVICVIFIE